MRKGRTKRGKVVIDKKYVEEGASRIPNVRHPTHEKEKNFVLHCVSMGREQRVEEMAQKRVEKEKKSDSKSHIAAMERMLEEMVSELDALERISASRGKRPTKVMEKEKEKCVEAPMRVKVASKRMCDSATVYWRDLQARRLEKGKKKVISWEHMVSKLMGQVVHPKMQEEWGKKLQFSRLEREEKKEEENFEQPIEEGVLIEEDVNAMVIELEEGDLLFDDEKEFLVSHKWEEEELSLVNEGNAFVFSLLESRRVEDHQGNLHVSLKEMTEVTEERSQEELQVSMKKTIEVDEV
ncbi:hypothetical protein KI387_005561 [Taxus chinensis]|uniref:Uncharacterized protein n=1 Tax=Taxus chinensis TaxID=29808 RepID=A0AA38LHR4_TAXCH|nr:hypothetical protein KI387_005561 [Taxus chinensis]